MFALGGFIEYEMWRTGDVLKHYKEIISLKLIKDAVAECFTSPKH